MSIREMIENREELSLSKYATLSKNSKGRKVKENQDEIRTCFAVDRDRIIHSMAFKRLRDKTQVFILPMIPQKHSDHFMTRLTHTLETAQVARTIATALNLNETLAEAILLVHDISHCCYGHSGEEALGSLFLPNGYEHEREVIRRAEYLEKRNGKRGLNLSWEVLDGAVNHSGFDNKPLASTKEGMIAPFADKIAYLVSDMENAINAGVISDIPASVKKVLGETKGHMMDTMIKDIIYTSRETNYVRMSDKIFTTTWEFRDFMFKNVYYSDVCRRQAERAYKIIGDLYEYLKKHPEEIPAEYEEDNLEQNIVDFISSMTDNYAIELYKKFFFI